MPIWDGSGSRQQPGDIISAIPALWLAAIALKVLLWLAAPDLVALDRAVNGALLVLAAVSVYRFTRLARSGVLWRVRRKLILSYILVGAVPILLLVAFSVLAFLLIFFDISSYLVHSRVAALTEQAGTFARTTLFEVERAPRSVDAVVRRRQGAISTRFPGVTVAVKPADTLPDWLKGEAFSGLVSVDGQLIARSVAFSAQRGFSDAVIVDLPLDRSFAGETLAPAGIHLGGERPRTLFNTATFLTHTNWQSGATGRTTLGMSIDVPALYRFLGQAQEGGATPNFNQALLYALVGVGLLLLVIEMVALGNGLALARSITTSVDELFDGTEHVKAGRFAHRIAVRSEDQLGQLASSFNDMTTRIQVLLREQDEKRRLAEELRIARDIQMSLLPQGPFNAPGLTVAALCVPAREVGGDYYDFLPLPDGRVGLLIADVSGKGTSAALYMAELKGLMLSLSRIHTSPRALLIEANHIISQHLDSRSFITMTYAVFDHAARTLTCARAGHCPFVRLPSGAAGERRAEMVVPDGMVLGLNLDGGRRFEQCLQEVTIPLQPGDLFLLFTDGISEAMDGSGDCFGEGRLTAFLEAHAGFAPEAIRDRLVEDVALFVQDQPQHDDLTMIILRVD